MKASDYEGNLLRQLSMNRETWRMLQERGVTEETPLRLDFFFYTKTRESAESLRTLIEQKTDYDVAVESARTWFQRTWCVKGTTQPQPVSLDILDQWVQWMIVAGKECSCDFDGWGTEASV
jgi:hypothetical protein